MICFGHRGAAGYAPENTLASVEKAISLGADWVEVDVYAVENELVVIHDDRLERTTNGSGYIIEQSLEYLRSLDAGEGEKIPFLREIFDLVDRRTGINIELKGPATAPPVSALIERYIKNRGWNNEQFLVSSFNHHELRTVKKINTQIQTGALIIALPLDYARFAGELDAFSVHPSIEFIDQAFVDDAHRRGLKVFVFTVNHAEDLARMQALGVDGIFTDYPDIMKR
jgi:glycerophosphoryl diester phosphodiesterase